MKKYLFISFCVSAAFFLTSCLKDKNIQDRVYGTDGVGDVKTIVISTGQQSDHELFASTNTFNLPFSTNDTTFELVAVKLTSDQPASHDIEVALDTSYKFLDLYNDTTNKKFHTSKHYQVPPTSIYSFPDGLVVRIPKGSNEGSIRIKMKSSDLVGKEYGFGLKLKSVSDPSYVLSGNFDNQVVLLGVKNKYHGTYTAKGYFYHPTASREINMTKEVVTASINSVIIDLGDLGSSKYWGLVTVDEATNKVTIVAAPGAAGGTYTMFTDGLPTSNPGFTAGWAGSSASYNRYDPATKTFYLRYGYMGGNGWRVTEEQITMK